MIFVAPGRDAVFLVGPQQQHPSVLVECCSGLGSGAVGGSGMCCYFTQSAMVFLERCILYISVSVSLHVLCPEVNRISALPQAPLIRFSPSESIC